MFLLLDKLRPTATGLDQIPAWFLRLAAPVIYQPLTRLFNLPFQQAQFPCMQWKQAIIRPVPKVEAPTKHDDFRPISITPFLTRLMERTVTQISLPCLLNTAQYYSVPRSIWLPTHRFYYSGFCLYPPCHHLPTQH